MIVRGRQLCGYVLTVTDKSPKKFRFTLVGRLQNYSLDVVEGLYKANLVYVRGSDDVGRMEERRELQRKAYVDLKTLAYLARTGKVVRRPRTSDRRRMRGKLKRCRHAYRVGKVDAEDVRRSVQSYRAHLAHGDCWKLERSLLSHLSLSNSTKGELVWDREHPLG